MARPRKNNITIDEEIIKQEEQVSKSKAKYDADVKKLKDLYAKKDEMKKRELLEAVEKSSKTFEEIMGFLKGDK
ncbi:ErpK protein [Lachnospiraceae bacterium BSM-380-WT-5A]|uniref:ErpK protein n=1 Tax=Oliverpabstia intestinalis TaxID=2606633 RepID=A0A7X2P4W4_9FIRM|nr:ErpK protein [Oliverpabstia intestinalis]MDD7219956.1 ErpK protein [Clostridia bacterium]MDY5555788.1 ErpK protein [Blautia sp.]MST67560.1 ErpK protein [Oliverpabstia intestinalis]